MLLDEVMPRFREPPSKGRICDLSEEPRRRGLRRRQRSVRILKKFSAGSECKLSVNLMRVHQRRTSLLRQIQVADVNFAPKCGWVDRTPKPVGARMHPDESRRIFLGLRSGANAGLKSAQTRHQIFSPEV